MSAQASPMPAERPTHWFEHYRSLLLLGISSVVALVAGGAVGALEPWPRALAQVGVALTLAGWLTWQVGRPLSQWGYGLRSVAAFVLTVLNPLYCIFAWIGYTDADEVFEGRAIWTAIGATAVTMALGQSGGIPVSIGHLLIFLALLGVNFGIAYIVGRQVFAEERLNAERKVAMVELERVNASLQQALDENAELHRTVVDQEREAATREERQRLAREIHDTTAQALAGILAQLNAARDDPDPAQVRRRIESTTELARAALVEARRSVMDLAPAPLADGSLADAIRSEAQDWVAHHPIRLDVVVTGDVRPLHAEVETSLLRIVQEGLSNIGKHAGATRVGVTLTYLDDEVALDVRDDGTGFDLQGPSRPDSFGLRGMRQRAERLAGVLEIETRPGQGTAVSVRLPAIGPGAA